MLETVTLASPLPTTRAAVTNGSRLHAGGVDGRTREARRFRDLVTSFAESLGGEGGLGEADKSLVRNAAALAVRAEAMQAAVVRGDDVDLEGLTRLSNCLSRVLDQLGIERERRDQAPSLADILQGGR